MKKRRLTNEEKRILQQRKRARKRRKALVIFLFLLIIAGIIAGIAFGLYRFSQTKAAEKAAREAQIAAEEAAIDANRAKIGEAAKLAEVYDYDGAIELLESIDDYEHNGEVVDAIASYTVQKTTLKAVDTTKVPHIFFHSLIVDTDRAFDVSLWGESEVAGINAWMTTIEEFDRIIQQLYDNGYVLVRMRDLVTQVTDESDNTVFKANPSLMLPEGKKAIVLSVDDWSYYHSYTGKGYGDKAVIDEDGKVKVQYTDASGNVSIGDYDVVPRLNSFVEEHPDFSYKGARGMLAMTGYNGVFGYRTDEDYVKREHLQKDQSDWLAQHPDFDENARQEEIRQAKAIADICKEEGWEFASHTWGHLSVTGKSAEALQEDNERWVKNVANIVGPTDTIIFAHGNDIGDWHPYNADTNPLYAYYKSVGYYYFANVDASGKYWVQIGNQFLRQGRIDCDGLQMWRAMSGTAKTNVFEDLFDVQTVFDERRPTPVSATGKS